MKENKQCEGVPHYFRPHQIPENDAFIRDRQHYCLPCFYLRLALKGDSEQAQKVLSGDFPKTPIKIDDIILPFVGDLRGHYEKTKNTK